MKGEKEGERIITFYEFDDKAAEEADKKGKGFKETEVGLIPEGWVVKKLGKIAKVTSGGTPSRIHQG
jgi:restriction endonuclease S subunit